VDSALLCRNCSWFGVYRNEVTERLTACPVCGSGALSLGDPSGQDWRELGRRLLEGEPAEQPPAPRHTPG
jgi:hypothetical protein